MQKFTAAAALAAGTALLTLQAPSITLETVPSATEQTGGSEISVARKGAGVIAKKTIGRIQLDKVNCEPLENAKRAVDRKDRTTMGIQFITAQDTRFAAAMKSRSLRRKSSVFIDPRDPVSAMPAPAVFAAHATIVSWQAEVRDG